MFQLHREALRIGRLEASAR